jgi:hypothetical protein
MPWWKCFPIHEIGRIDGGRGFRTRKNVFRIGGNTFYNRKNKISMKIPESKRSKIEKIAEFRRITNGFPNLDWLVVVSPLVLPPSHRPLTPPLSPRLALACCCIPSCHATASSSLCAALSSSHRPLTALPSRHLIAPAGCCVAFHPTALTSSSHRAALLSSCSSRLLCCLSLHRPLVLLSCRPLDLSSSSHCAALLLSHLTGWLLHRLSLYRPLVVLSLRRSLIVLHRHVVASTLVTPPSCPLVMPPSHPLIIL